MLQIGENSSVFVDADLQKLLMIMHYPDQSLARTIATTLSTIQVTIAIDNAPTNAPPKPYTVSPFTKLAVVINIGAAVNRLVMTHAKTSGGVNEKAFSQIQRTPAISTAIAKVSDNNTPIIIPAILISCIFLLKNLL